MKKILFCLFLLILPISVNAECSSIEITRLKALAGNIDVTYDYTEKDDNVTFSATLHNVDKNLSIKKIYQSGNYKNTNGDVKIGNIMSGVTISIDVLANKCNNEHIYTKYIVTPYFNPYYSDPLCVGNETKSLCQKWINTSNISYEKFTNSFKTESIVDPIVTTEKTFLEKPLVLAISKTFFSFRHICLFFTLIQC